MKKLSHIALATALVFSLAACGGAATTDNATDDTSTDEPTEATQLLGGWTINSETPDKAIDEVQASIFMQAMSEVVGVNYEPVAVIGQQLVSGMNYAYLCKSSVVHPNASTEWTVVVIYQDLDGNATFKGAAPLDIADLHVLEGEKGAAMGAWSTPAPGEGVDLPTKAQDAFYAAVDAMEDDYMLAPQALLATQLVSGTNYQVLCIGRTPAEGDGPWTVYDVTIYEDLEGNATVSSISALDLDFYVTPPVEE